VRGPRALSSSHSNCTIHASVEEALGGLQRGALGRPAPHRLGFGAARHRAGPGTQPGCATGPSAGTASCLHSRSAT